MPKAAYAGTGACSKGYACVWNDSGYNGGSRAEHLSSILLPLKYNNEASSAAANGGSCRATYFYDAWDGTGKYFILNSQTLVKKNYRDPYLANGAGIGTHSGENWNDRVSHIKFGQC